jgi:LemA protein
VARNDYNASVEDYNATRSRFPTVISAKIFGFAPEPYFKAEERAKEVPQINANSLRDTTK